MDAVIVQDLGVARMLRQVAPDLPLHASTQMTVHSLDGVKACADLGFTRVVLGRELSRDQIAYICQHSPVEIEVFGHGGPVHVLVRPVLPLLGNRGAQRQPGAVRPALPPPVRLERPGRRLPPVPEGPVHGPAPEGAVRHGGGLSEAGGPDEAAEYVAIVTGIYSRAIREGRDPGPEELETLERAFSRQGFTDGYYMGRPGPEMFGTRQEEKEPRELYAQARATYESGENRKEPVRLYALIQADRPAQVAAEDGLGHLARVEGPVPEGARNVPLTREKVEGQLSRTGGTPYRCEKATARVEEGLSLPLSAPERPAPPGAGGAVPTAAGAAPAPAGRVPPRGAL